MLFPLTPTLSPPSTGGEREPESATYFGAVPYGRRCHRLIEDWHIEWYMAERSDLYRGLVAMDCPLCGQPVGYVQGSYRSSAARRTTAEALLGKGGRLGGARGHVCRWNLKWITFD